MQSLVLPIVFLIRIHGLESTSYSPNLYQMPSSFPIINGNPSDNNLSSAATATAQLPPSPTALVGGMAFFDATNDGIRDPFLDYPFSNITVTLRSCNSTGENASSNGTLGDAGSTVDNSTTIAQNFTSFEGTYKFDYLNAGSYYISVEYLPWFYTFSTVWNGMINSTTGEVLFPNVNSTINPLTNRSNCFTLSDNEKKEGVSFGLRLNIPTQSGPTNPVSGLPSINTINTVTNSTSPTVSPSTKTSSTINPSLNVNVSTTPSAVAIPTESPSSITSVLVSDGSNGTASATTNSTEGMNATIVVMPTSSPVTNENVTNVVNNTTSPNATSPPSFAPSGTVLDGSNTDSNMTIPPTPAPIVTNLIENGTTTNSTATMNPSTYSSTVVVPSIFPTTASSYASPTSSSPSEGLTLSPVTTSPTNTTSYESPTPEPSSMPIKSIVSSTVDGQLIGPITTNKLVMTIVGLSSLENETEWSNYTSQYIESFFNTDVSKKASNVDVNIVITGQRETDIESSRSLREKTVWRTGSLSGPSLKQLQHQVEGGSHRLLQDKAMEVTYDQTTTYRTMNATEVDIYYVIQEPFGTTIDRSLYVASLWNQSSYYKSIIAVSPVSLPVDPTLEKVVAPSPTPQGSNQMPMIIGVVCGVGVVLLLGIVFLAYRRRRKSGYAETVGNGPVLETSTVKRDLENGNAVPPKVETIDIIAPSGKLGVVVDTPPDRQGPAFVCDVRQSSPLANKIQLFDKIIAVDDEDVQKMSAIKVSKLLSEKSENSERKITILRECEVAPP